MDKRSEYILKMYSEASSLIKKDAGWFGLGNVALLLNPLTFGIGVFSVAMNAIGALFNSVAEVHKNLNETVTTVIAELEKSKSSGASTYNSLASTYVRELRAELPNISLKNISLDAKTEIKIRENIKLIVNARYALDRLKKTFNKILMPEFEKAYKDETMNLMRGYRKYFSFTGDIIEWLQDSSKKGITQIDEFTSNIDTMLSTIKEKMIEETSVDNQQQEQSKQTEVDEIMSSMKEQAAPTTTNTPNTPTTAKPVAPAATPPKA